MLGTTSKVSADWQELAVDDLLLDIQPGFARRPSSEGEVKHLRTNNISPEGKLDLSRIKHVRATKDEVQKYCLRKGDVLFNNTNSDMWVGKTAFVNRDLDALYSNHLTRLRADTSKIDPRFLAIYLHKLQRDGFFKSISTRWVNQTAVNTNALRQLRLKIPPPEHQARIVQILDRADRLKQMREQANQLTSKISQSIFLKMFGDPVLNPFGYPTMTVGELAVMCRYGPRFYNQPYSNKGVPILRTTDITEDGELSLEHAPKLEVSTEDLERYRLRTGDLVVSRSGTLGRCAIYDMENGDCIPGAFLLHFRFAEKVLPAYIQHFILSASVQQKIRNMGRFVAQPNINAKEVKSLRVPVSPLELQRRFDETRLSFRRTKRRQEESLHEINALIHSLMQKAFAGQLVA